MTAPNDMPADTELREIQDFISRLETGGFDYDTLRKGTVSKIRVDELMQLIKQRDKARDAAILDTIQKAKNALDMDMPEMAKVLLASQIIILTPSDQKEKE